MSAVAHGWGEHVGELELWIESGSAEEVFAEALHALGDLIAGDEERTPAEWRAVRVEADELPLLLADWLGELAFMAEVEGFVPDAVKGLELGRGFVQARVGGHRGDPAHLVKAVTYHRLCFEPHAAGWRAAAVLDV